MTEKELKDAFTHPDSSLKTSHPNTSINYMYAKPAFDARPGDSLRQFRPRHSFRPSYLSLRTFLHPPQMKALDRDTGDDNIGQHRQPLHRLLTMQYQPALNTSARSS